MRTVAFPRKADLIAGVSSRSERSAYLDGLAILQEVAAITERYSPARSEAAKELQWSAKTMPHLGTHLIECAQKVLSSKSAQYSTGAVEPLADEVELLHLRESMKERLVDVAVQATAHSPDHLRQTYDRAKVEGTALRRDISVMRACSFPDPAIMRTLGIESLPRTSSGNLIT